MAHTTEAVTWLVPGYWTPLPDLRPLKLDPIKAIAKGTSRVDYRLLQGLGGEEFH